MNYDVSLYVIEMKRNMTVYYGFDRLLSCCAFLTSKRSNYGIFAYEYHPNSIEGVNFLKKTTKNELQNILETGFPALMDCWKGVRDYCSEDLGVLCTTMQRYDKKIPIAFHNIVHDKNFIKSNSGKISLIGREQKCDLIENILSKYIQSRLPDVKK